MLSLILQRRAGNPAVSGNPRRKKKPPPTHRLLLRTHARGVRWGAGRAENAEKRVPSPFPSFSLTDHLHTSSLNYKAANGESGSSAAVSSRLMINDRNSGRCGNEFSLKREFRKIQCPLFLFVSSLLHIHISIYIFYIYIYILFAGCAPHFKRNVWSARSSDGSEERENRGIKGGLGMGRGEKKTPVSSVQRY